MIKDTYLLAEDSAWARHYLSELRKLGYRAELIETNMASLEGKISPETLFLLPVYGPEDPLINSVKDVTKADANLVILAGRDLNTVAFMSLANGTIACFQSSLNPDPRLIELLRKL